MSPLRTLLLNLWGPVIGLPFLGDVVVERRRKMALWWAVGLAFYLSFLLVYELPWDMDIYIAGAIFLMTMFLLAPLLVGAWFASLYRSARELRRIPTHRPLALYAGGLAALMVGASLVQVYLAELDSDLQQDWGIQLRAVVVGILWLSALILSVLVIAIRPAGERGIEMAEIANSLGPVIGLTGAGMLLRRRCRYALVTLPLGLLLFLMSGLFVFEAWGDQTQWGPLEVYLAAAAPLSYGVLWISANIEWGAQGPSGTAIPAAPENQERRQPLQQADQ